MLWPLADAVAGPVQLVTYFRSIGYEIDLAEAEHVLTEVEPEATALTEAFKLASSSGSDVASVTAIALAAPDLVSALARQISLAVGDGAEQSDVHDEVFCSLLRYYLGTRLPAAVAVLEALGVIIEPNAPAVAGATPPVDSAKVVFNWARLADFIRDTDQWALDVYGWGEADADSAVIRPRLRYGSDRENRRSASDCNDPSQVAAPG